jgi:DNA-binding NarL/FixJ family response regulator
MSANNSITVAILSDYPIVRESLAYVLNASEVVSAVCAPLPPADSERGGDYDVIFCVMETRPNLEAFLREVKELYENAKLCCLLLTDDDKAILAALRAGATGIIDSSDSFSPGSEVLASQLAAVARGEFVLPAAVAMRLARLHVAGGDVGSSPTHPESLTRREEEVLGLLKEGYSNREIAERLSVSEHTVRAHLRGIMQKLQVTNRGQAAALAWREGVPQVRLRREVNVHTYRRR